MRTIDAVRLEPTNTVIRKAVITLLASTKVGPLFVALRVAETTERNELPGVCVLSTHVRTVHLGISRSLRERQMIIVFGI